MTEINVPKVGGSDTLKVLNLQNIAKPNVCPGSKAPTPKYNKILKILKSQKALTMDNIRRVVQGLIDRPPANNDLQGRIVEILQQIKQEHRHEFAEQVRSVHSTGTPRLAEASPTSLRVPQVSQTTPSRDSPTLERDASEADSSVSHRLPELANLQLEGSTLKGKKLSHCTLTRCILVGCELHDCKLQDSKVIDCDIC